MRIDLTLPAAQRQKIDKENAIKVDSSEVKVDVLLSQLSVLTSQQAALWIDSNVNSLADAKQVLRSFAKIIVYLLKKES